MFKSMTTRAFGAKEDGATAIEFALLLPILLILLFGVIEFSLITFTKSVLETATNKAARFGITGTINQNFNNPGTTDREQFIREEVIDRTYGLLDPARVQILSQIYGSIDAVDIGNANPSDSAGFGARGDVVLYNVTYDWNLLTPLASEIFGNVDGNLVLNSSVIIANE